MLHSNISRGHPKQSNNGKMTTYIWCISADPTRFLHYTHYNA